MTKIALVLGRTNMSESSKEKQLSVGVDVSVSGFHAVSVDASGKVAASISEKLDRNGDVIAQLIAFVGKLNDSLGETSRFGLSVPGLINRRSNRVEYSIGFPEHSKTDIANEIKVATGLECVLMNDADAAAIGEFKAGAGRGAKDLFYATLGTGVGGAFIFNGQIWRGVSGFAGEFGYVAINSDGMRLEDVASSENIVRRTRSRFHQDSTSVLSKFDEQEITIADIVAAARSEDDFAQLMLDRTGMYVGSAIASVINLLNIERIVLGGEIMGAGRLLLDPIIKRARELSFGPSFSNTTIVAGELGELASAIGAALSNDETLGG